jgi:hypothetical protein
MYKSYHVRLTDTERAYLTELIAAGTAPARKLLPARILLKADEGPAGPAWVDQAIADAVEVSQPTVSRVRKQYVAQGLEAPASLYEAFPPAEVQRLADKLEIHHTPKHGSYPSIQE